MRPINVAPNVRRNARESLRSGRAASRSNEVSRSRSVFTARLRNLETSRLRVVPANGLGLSLAHLHRHLAPLRAGLHAVGVEAEDVLGAQLVLDVAVDASQIGSLFDEVGISASLGAELRQLVADVDFGRPDADADGVNRHGRAPGVLQRLL